MATTQITNTAFQGALADCADAIVAGNYPAARSHYARAVVIKTGLVTDLTDQHVRVRYTESLEETRKAIEMAESAGGANGDQRRMIRTKMGF